MHGAIKFSIDGQIGAAVGILCRKRFIDFHAQAGSFAGMHCAFGKCIAVREDLIGFLGMMHVFLDAEIVHAEVKVERRSHADWAHIRRAMTTRADVMDFREGGDLPQVSDSTSMHDSGPYVVNQLFLDEPLAIVNRVEDFADGNGSRSVLANQAKTILKLGGSGIFQPEKMIWLEALAQARGFNRRQAMVGIMQKREILAELLAQARE